MKAYLRFGASQFDLSLTAQAGWSDEELNRLFDPDSFVASILGSLTAPLFNSGQLRADVEAAQARRDAFVSAYAAQVLTAVREVQDALISEQRLRAELTERTRQRDEALLAETLARDRYRRGLEELLTVLDTERRRAEAEDFVLVLQASVWDARINLHLALGGDWFIDPETTP